MHPTKSNGQKLGELKSRKLRARPQGLTLVKQDNRIENALVKCSEDLNVFM